MEINVAWLSAKRDITLAIGYNGKYMCGFFFGPDMPKPKLMSAFILGRKPEDVETGKRKLMQAKIVYPRAKSTALLE
jgi:hypothetical protein